MRHTNITLWIICFFCSQLHMVLGLAYPDQQGILAEGATEVSALNSNRYFIAGKQSTTQKVILR